MKVQSGENISPPSSEPPSASSSPLLSALDSVSNDSKTLSGHRATDTTLPLTAATTRSDSCSSLDISPDLTPKATGIQPEWLYTYFPDVETEEIYFFASKWGVTDLISVGALLTAVADKIDKYREVSSDQTYLYRAMPTKFLDLENKTITNWRGGCAAINNRHDTERVTVSEHDVSTLPKKFMQVRDLPNGGISFLVEFQDEGYTNPYMREDDTSIRCRLSDVFAVKGRIHTDYSAATPNCIVAELPRGQVIPFELVNTVGMSR